MEDLIGNTRFDIYVSFYWSFSNYFAVTQSNANHLFLNPHEEYYVSNLSECEHVALNGTRGTVS